MHAIEYLKEHEPELTEWIRFDAGRAEAENELRRSRNGAFVIRRSSAENSVSISYKSAAENGRIMHYLVNVHRWEDGLQTYSLPSRADEAHERFTDLLESIDLWPQITTAVTALSPVVYERLPADLVEECSSSVAEGADGDTADNADKDRVAAPLKKEVIYGALPIVQNRGGGPRERSVFEELVERTAEAATTVNAYNDRNRDKKVVGTDATLAAVRVREEFPAAPRRPPPKPPVRRARANSDPSGLDDAVRNRDEQPATSTTSSAADRHTDALDSSEDEYERYLLAPESTLLDTVDDAGSLTEAHRRVSAAVALRVSRIDGLRCLFAIVLCIGVASLPTALPYDQATGAWASFQKRCVAVAAFALLTLEGMEVQLLCQLRARNIKHARTRFVESQFFRLWPTYMVALAFGSFLFATTYLAERSAGVTALSVITTLLGLQSWLPITALYWAPSLFLFSSSLPAVLAYVFVHDRVRAWSSNDAHWRVCISSLSVLALLQATPFAAYAVSGASGGPGANAHDWWSGVPNADLWFVAVLSWPPLAGLVVIGGALLAFSCRHVSLYARLPCNRIGCAILETLAYASLFAAMALAPFNHHAELKAEAIGALSLDSWQAAAVNVIGPLTLWPLLTFTVFGNSYSVLGRLFSSTLAMRRAVSPGRALVYTSPLMLLHILLDERVLPTENGGVVQRLGSGGYMSLMLAVCICASACLHFVALAPLQRVADRTFRRYASDSSSVPLLS